MPPTMFAASKPQPCKRLGGAGAAGARTAHAHDAAVHRQLEAGALELAEWHPLRRRRVAGLPLVGFRTSSSTCRSLPLSASTALTSGMRLPWNMLTGVPRFVVGLRRSRAGACSRPCRRASARASRRPPRAWAPCTRRASRGSARPARRRRSSARRTLCTSATTISPHRSSGIPTTTQSNTSGCDRSASSTSSGYTFSPPVLMHADPRPSSRIVPSASTVA